MKRFNAKYSDALFKVFLTLIMSLLMSTVITVLNIGIVPNFLEKWVVAFLGGFVVSFPAILIAVPIARRLVKRITLLKAPERQAF